MSYILDALKKTEAEQDPDLRTSLAVDQQNQRRNRFGQYLIVAALLGNLLVLVWLFGPFSPRNTNNDAAAEVATEAPAAPKEQPAAPKEQPAAPNKQPAAPEEQSAALKEQPAAPNKQTGAVPASAPTEQAATTAARKPAPPKPAATVHTNLAGLSAAARRRFPELSFSTHLYASDSSMRAVVVNGERLTEGDRLGNLVLTNITETGVVFRFENYLVTISVLDDWE